MAIAFDSASATASTCSVSTKTVTHTCSGTDRVLFAQVANHSAHGTISGVTYNSVALTKLLEYNDGNTIVGLWYLVAPDTGSAFDLTVTCTVGTGCLCIGGLSFTGASQTGIPDASVSGAVGTTTSFTQTVTSVADNCFAVWSFKAGGGFALTGGTNTTVGSQPEACLTWACFWILNSIKNTSWLFRTQYDIIISGVYGYLGFVCTIRCILHTIPR